MKLTGRLHKNYTNQILYRSTHYYNVTQYEQILHTLPINKKHYGFVYETPNTCYPYGVFGTVGKGNKREVVDYVLKKVNITQSTCSHSVILVQRRNRRILNMAEVLQTARYIGYTDARIVYMENYKVDEQLKLAACARIIVGVHGAGLQWAIFMPMGSTMIEVAWPKKHWPYFYGSGLESNGINPIEINPEKVIPNFEAYEKDYNNAKTIFFEN